MFIYRLLNIERISFQKPWWYACTVIVIFSSFIHSFTHSFSCFEFVYFVHLFLYFSEVFGFWYVWCSAVTSKCLKCNLTLAIIYQSQCAAKPLALFFSNAQYTKVMWSSILECNATAAQCAKSSKKDEIQSLQAFEMERKIVIQIDRR